MAIVLQNVSYTYMANTPLERQALSDISLEIQEGSFTAIAGHTGSGKSTLLQHLNGLIHPTAGHVLVDGVDLQPRKKAARRRAKAAARQVGMVFQYPEQQLFEETVEKDIAFGPRNLGLPEEEIQGRVREALDLMHLDYDTFKDVSPFALSGGQMRRVAIAGVLALRPKYLVLDEPTAGLDPRGRQELMETITRLHREKNVTILFVSHNMDDIVRLADKVLVLSMGRLLVHDTPLKVFQEDKLLEEAGLQPPEAFKLAACLREAGLALPADTMREEDVVSRILALFWERRG